MSEQPQEISREGLKILALKERLAEVEDANADLRVEITYLTHSNRELLAQIEALQADEAKEDEPLTDDAAK